MLNRFPLADALLLATIFYFLMPAPAHAYFDLGAGTYMVQLIFGFGAAYWLSFRSWWKKKAAPDKVPPGEKQVVEKTEEKESN